MNSQLEDALRILNALNDLSLDDVSVNSLNPNLHYHDSKQEQQRIDDAVNDIYNSIDFDFLDNGGNEGCDDGESDFSDDPVERDDESVDSASVNEKDSEILYEHECGAIYCVDVSSSSAKAAAVTNEVHNSKTSRTDDPNKRDKSDMGMQKFAFSTTLFDLKVNERIMSILIAITCVSPIQILFFNRVCAVKE